MATITIEDSTYLYDQAILGSDAVADVLAGTDDATRYYINGLGGDDTLTGAGADDILVGGRGSDLLTGGAGNDILIGDHVDAEGEIVEDARIDAIFTAIVPPGVNANWKAWENYQHRLEEFFEHINLDATYKHDGTVVTGQQLLDAWTTYKDNLKIEDVHVISGPKIANIKGHDTAIHDITDNADLWEHLTGHDGHAASAAFLDFGRIEPVGTPAAAAPVDTAVFSGLADDYTITVTCDGATVTDNVGTDGTDTLIGIERLQFSDRSVDLTWFAKTAELSLADVTHLTELYIASFDRAPDATGLAYWGSQLKDGMSLRKIAQSFFAQPEAAAAYPLGQSIADFIATVYQNVLDRAPDAPGLAYWRGELGEHHISQDSFLLAIINGAHAGSADAQLLANKGLVGMHFALTRGLNDGDEAKAVMADVDASVESVAAAHHRIDAIAGHGEGECIVKIVGISG